MNADSMLVSPTLYHLVSSCINPCIILYQCMDLHIVFDQLWTVCSAVISDTKRYKQIQTDTTQWHHIFIRTRIAESRYNGYKHLFS